MAAVFCGRVEATREWSGRRRGRPLQRVHAHAHAHAVFHKLWPDRPGETDIARFFTITQAYYFTHAEIRDFRLS